MRCESAPHLTLTQETGNQGSAQRRPIPVGPVRCRLWTMHLSGSSCPTDVDQCCRSHRECPARKHPTRERGCVCGLSCATAANSAAPTNPALVHQLPQFGLVLL